MSEKCVFDRPLSLWCKSSVSTPLFRALWAIAVMGFVFAVAAPAAFAATPDSEGYLPRVSAAVADANSAVKKLDSSKLDALIDAMASKMMDGTADPDAVLASVEAVVSELDNVIGNYESAQARFDRARAIITGASEKSKSTEGTRASQLKAAAEAMTAPLERDARQLAERVRDARAHGDTATAARLAAQLVEKTRNLDFAAEQAKAIASVGTNKTNTVASAMGALDTSLMYASSSLERTQIRMSAVRLKFASAVDVLRTTREVTALTGLVKDLAASPEASAETEASADALGKKVTAEAEKAAAALDRAVAAAGGNTSPAAASRAPLTDAELDKLLSRWSSPETPAKSH